jgi:hypothetical protein
MMFAQVVFMGGYTIPHEADFVPPVKLWINELGQSILEGEI